MIKVLSHPFPCEGPSPLLRAFKWGTVHGFSSRSIKTTRCRRFRIPILLNKSGLFVQMSLIFESFDALWGKNSYSISFDRCQWWWIILVVVTFLHRSTHLKVSTLFTSYSTLIFITYLIILKIGWYWKSNISWPYSITFSFQNWKSWKCYDASLWRKCQCCSKK